MPHKRQSWAGRELEFAVGAAVPVRSLLGAGESEVILTALTVLVSAQDAGV